jgi:hypothetical protein
MQKKYIKLVAFSAKICFLVTLVRRPIIADIKYRTSARFEQRNYLPFGRLLLLLQQTENELLMGEYSFDDFARY